MISFQTIFIYMHEAFCFYDYYIVLGVLFAILQVVLYNTRLNSSDIKQSLSISLLNESNSNSKAEISDKIEDVAYVYAIQGKRDYMEDRYDMKVSKEQDHTFKYFAVFDGHGGSFAAQYLSEHLMKKFEDFQLNNNVDFVESSFKNQIVDAYQDLDKDLCNNLCSLKMNSGSTALVTILTECNRLICINLGDSRAILYSNNNTTYRLSTDHKPNLPDEKDRIEANGGFIRYTGVWRLLGILATSRAFGDIHLKATGTLSVEPEISVYYLPDLDPHFVIIASDGLWDVVNDIEAAEFVRDHLHEPDNGAQSLVMYAFNKKRSSDNITVMVILLSNYSTDESQNAVDE